MFLKLIDNTVHECVEVENDVYTIKEPRFDIKDSVNDLFYTQSLYLATRIHETEIIAKASTEQELEHIVSGWSEYNNAPKTGVFLVYIPREYLENRIQVMCKGDKVITVGFSFAFDIEAPTMYKSLPK